MLSSKLNISERSVWEWQILKKSEWDSNYLPPDYEPEVQANTLSLHGTL